MKSHSNVVGHFFCAAAAGVLTCQQAGAQTIQIIAASSPAWQSTYSSFATQASFETLSLPADLSITLQGQSFASPQTYGSLPRLFDPVTVISSGGFGGPYTNNRWDGTYMVTNFGYDPALAAGQNWINAWAPTTGSLSARFTFNFSNGVTAVGVGLSNFQTDVTSHTLYINGVAYSQTVESIAGANWVSGRLIRNGYLVVTAAPGVPIYSIGIGNINAPDGLTFDALGYNPVPVPATATAILFTASALGLRRRTR